jgi:hypothetical protein
MRGLVAKTLAGLGICAALGLAPVGVAGASNSYDGSSWISSSYEGSCYIHVSSSGIGDPNPGRHDAHTTFIWVRNNDRLFLEPISCDQPPPSNSTLLTG